MTATGRAAQCTLDAMQAPPHNARTVQATNRNVFTLVCHGALWIENQGYRRIAREHRHQVADVTKRYKHARKGQGELREADPSQDGSRSDAAVDDGFIRVLNFGLDVWSTRRWAKASSMGRHCLEVDSTRLVKLEAGSKRSQAGTRWLRVDGLVPS